METETGKSLVGATGRDLAYAAFRRDWDASTIAREVNSPQTVDHALEEYERNMEPLAKRDRRFRSMLPEEVGAAIGDHEQSRQMLECVKMIGRKVRPDFSTDQAMQWSGALVASLTDLPAPVGVAACLDARHMPFRFPADVEIGIRECAVAAASRHDLAMSRLRALKRDIMAAGRKSLPPPKVDPLTQDEVDAMSPELQRIGIDNGYLIRNTDGRCIIAPVEADLI